MPFSQWTKKAEMEKSADKFIGSDNCRQYLIFRDLII